MVIFNILTGGKHPFGNRMHRNRQNDNANRRPHIGNRCMPRVRPRTDFVMKLVEGRFEFEELYWRGVSDGAKVLETDRDM